MIVLIDTLKNGARKKNIIEAISGERVHHETTCMNL